MATHLWGDEWPGNTIPSSIPRKTKLQEIFPAHYRAWVWKVGGWTLGVLLALPLVILAQAALVQALGPRQMLVAP